MHIYLAGYRGCGKSTVGRLLAQQLGWPFVDSDEQIESGGLSIRELFEQFGEAGFRDREQEAIRHIATCPAATVVALGGGAVLREANRELIAQTGRCAWLQGSAQVLYQRINADDGTEANRPNLTSRGGYDEVAEVLSMRAPIYDQVSEITVLTDDKSPDEITAELAAWATQLG